MITRSLLTIAGVVALTYATRSFVPRGATVTGSGAALAFGFLLIVAVQAARICDALKAPRLTGYIIIGILFGPELVGVVASKMLPDLALVKGTAIGLIAFMAGCELNFRSLRPQLRAIGAATALTMIAEVLLLFGLFYAFTFILPVTREFSVLERMIVAGVASNVLAAYSPAVVVAILSETKASGRLSETTLSIVVIADLIIVITYALTSSIGHVVFKGAGAEPGGLDLLLPHIFGSIATGMLVGGLLAIYVSQVSSRSGMFTFAILFVVAEVGAAFHLNPLLVGLSAGLLLENVMPIGGEEVTDALEGVATPTFAIFFAVIGAELQLGAFIHTVPFAVAAAGVRAIGIYSGARLAARFGRYDALFARRLTYGLAPQAGVAIALAALLLADFKPWGPVVGTIVLGTIIVNQLVGPVLFRNAIVDSGESALTRTDGATEEIAVTPA